MCSDKNSEQRPLEIFKKKFQQQVRHLQNQITKELKKIDSNIRLIQDDWKRKDFKGGDGGGGQTRAFVGQVIENAGVNTSLIFGEMTPQLTKQIKGKSLENDREKNSKIWACGLSLIIHPRNPRIPTAHANFRMIQWGNESWFGGGADLTPYYPHLEDFRHFHQVWKRACSPYGSYNWMKKACDEYFVNTHRQGEMRGIGGIFFDHYNSGNLEQDYKMVSHLADHFIESYFPIVSGRKIEKWTHEEEDFQLYRRGRYVEFNLLHDRGTHFGLKSGGRTESILISLPARCRFNYEGPPPLKGPCQQMEAYYRPHDWANWA